MDDHRHTIAGEPHIKFNSISAVLQGARKGDERVFRSDT
jgi:hypothetical protein